MGRRAVDETAYTWQTLDDLAEKSLLKLRAAIPKKMRTGRYLNFGTGHCGDRDPMFFLFKNQRNDDRVLANKQRNVAAREKELGVKLEDLGKGLRVVKESSKLTEVGKLTEVASPAHSHHSDHGEKEHDHEEEEEDAFISSSAEIGAEKVKEIEKRAEKDSEKQRKDEEHYAQHYAQERKEKEHAILENDPNLPPWNGFGFELYKDVAEKCKYPNTTIILGSVDPETLPAILGKTGFFPTLLVETEDELYLRKNPHLDARILTEAQEVHLGKRERFVGNKRPEIAVIETKPQIVKPSQLLHKNASLVYGDKSPDLIEERDDVEDVVDKLGGREAIWDYQRKLNDRPWRDQYRDVFENQENQDEPDQEPTSVGPDIELVVIDLDAYDYQILELLVATRQTVLIYRVEVAQHIPPPYKYAMLYHPEKIKMYREHMKYDSDMYFSPLYGMSLSAAVDLLKDTHFLLYLDAKTDAVFVHKKLRKYVEPFFNIELPVDEFLCYRSSHLWHQMNQLYVRAWAFNEPVHEGLRHIHDNMTHFSPVPIEQGNVPFLLWV